MNLHSTWMSDHLVKTSTKSKLRSMYLAKKDLINKKLSNNEPDHYIDGWPLSNNILLRK